MRHLTQLALMWALSLVPVTRAAAAVEEAGGLNGLTQPRQIPITLVVNGLESRAERNASDAAVLDACKSLVSASGGQLLDAGLAYSKQFGRPLAVGRYPSREAGEAARWLRGWLAGQVKEGTVLVLIGDETVIPTWQVRIGSILLNADSFYSDLDGNGVPETAVARVLGLPAQVVRQLRGKRIPGSKAAILCSEDTRIHLETRAFANFLSQSGYEVVIRGSRNDDALANSDILIHFGHGSDSGLFNRFGKMFVHVATMPELARSPIVFADGCGTLPPGSPLLRAFLDHGALAYCGSAQTVQGMIPARFANELVEHFIRVLTQHGELSLPQVLLAARAAYVRGHPGLQELLREAATKDAVSVAGDEAMDLLTVAEWVYYGDPRATVPVAGVPRPFGRQAAAIVEPVSLTPESPCWKVAFASRRNEGQAVLALYCEVPLTERSRYRFTVLQNGQALAQLDSHRDTQYQTLGNDCRGGYVCGQTYRARYLIPLRPGGGELEVRLSDGASATLTSGTAIEVWESGFEGEIQLMSDAPRAGSRPAAVREPMKVVGEAKLRPTAIPDFFAVELGALFNRPHNSTKVGGGDDASFHTWFLRDEVLVNGVPFAVQRSGNDVLVSANNSQNVFEIEDLNSTAEAVYFLVWGYNYPAPAKLSLGFDDGTSQACELPLDEWTEGGASAAVDFENTISAFHHAALAYREVRIAQKGKKVTRISSNGGTYGLVAITLGPARP